MSSIDVSQKSQILAQLNTAYQSRVSDVNRSIELSNGALKMARKLNDPTLMGTCLNHLSLFYMIVGQNQLSMEASREAIAFFTEQGDELGLADAKYNIGSVYYKTDNYHSGLTHLVDALAVYRRYNEYAKQSRVYKALGTIYEFFGDEKSAVTSYQHAIDAARQVSDLNLESNAFNPLSGIYLNQNNVDKAVTFIENSIEIKNKTGDIRGLAFALYGRGKIYTYTKNYAAAEADFKEAERIHLQMGEKLGLAMNYYKIGVLYLAMGKLHDAITVLNTGRSFSIKHNISQFKHKCAFQLYQAYKQLGDIEKSLLYLEEHLSVKDAVINIETLKVIENYELISQQQLLENKELQQAKEQAEIQNKALMKANAELDQLVYHASHDLRAPLSSIMGLVNLGMMTDNKKEMKRCFHLINERVEAQDYFIKEIVDYSRNARLATELKDIAIKKFLLEVIQSLSFLEGAGQIKMEVNIDTNLIIKSDPSRLKVIFNNLISNAIKYCDLNKSNQFITVQCQPQNQQWILTVKDNGIGILEDLQDKVFDMFYRGTTRSTGSGLGLFIVKETVEKLGGGIEFESQYNVGSTFKVSLPK